MILYQLQNVGKSVLKKKTFIYIIYSHFSFIAVSQKLKMYRAEE